MPGERRPTLAKSKGIHDLTVHEQDLLADALKMNSITVQQVSSDKAHHKIMTSHAPIIFREAPQWDSQNLHGRRAFLNGQIDRKGLSHVKMAEASPEPSSEASVVLSLPAPSHQLCRRILWVLSPEDSPVLSPISSHHHSPAVSPAPLHHPKVQVFIELPRAPPSWRLKAIWHHSSPVSRPETSMLIPQINYLSQLSATMDGIFNEEEETDKVLT